MIMKDYILTDALKNKYSIGAFNFGNLETLKGIIDGVNSQKSPVVIQISEGAIKYLGDTYVKSLIAVAKNEVKVPALFHLDHGANFEIVKKAIDLGCNSVMIDGSSLPFDENVEITKKVVQYAHKKGVFVEGELGAIAGIEDEKQVDDKNSFYTSPEQAKEFVKLTKVDSLAIAIGTKHGAYKFGKSAKLRFDILKKIEERVPNTPLVLHGASSVDKSSVKNLFEMGVDISSANGVDEKVLKKLSKTHICKINQDTDIRIEMLTGLLTNIKENKTNIDYRKYLSAGQERVKELVASRAKLFGSKNRAK